MIGAFSAVAVMILSASGPRFGTFIFYYPLVWLVPWLAVWALAAVLLRQPSWLVPAAGIAVPAVVLFLANGGWLGVMGLAHVGYVVAAWLMMRNEPVARNGEGHRGAI